MKQVFLMGVLIAIIAGCAYVNSTERVFFSSETYHEPSKYLIVCVTFYNQHEGPWGDKKSTGGRLTSFRSAAVDPKVIPYGTRLLLPGFTELLAEDTGSAVKDKLASRLRASKWYNEGKVDQQHFDILRQAPVVDIYVSDMKEYSRLITTTPYFMVATLIK